MHFNKLFSKFIRSRYNPNTFLSQTISIIHYLLTASYLLIFLFLIYSLYKLSTYPPDNGWSGYPLFLIGSILCIIALISFFIQSLLALIKFKFSLIFYIVLIPIMLNVVLFYFFYSLWQETFTISFFVICIWILFCSFSFLLTKKST